MNLQTRVVNILKQPKEEWPVIAAEPTDVQSLFMNYIVPLSAIPAICRAIGMVVIGVQIPLFGTYRYSLTAALGTAVVGYVLGLVGVFVAALVIEKLAPSFNSRPDRIQALKLVAYASTPAWVAGVLYLIPLLSPIVLLASLYGIYLFYLGLPPTMQTPQDKVIVYMIVSAVVLIVVYFIVGMITAALTAAFFITTPTFRGF